MHATTRRPLWMSRGIVVLLLSAAALALTLTQLASAQSVDVGGSATGTASWEFGSGTLPPQTLTLAVTGTPQAAAGPVTYRASFGNFVGEARCIAIDETPTGFRASIAGEIVSGVGGVFVGFRGFALTVYDNTPSAQRDQASDIMRSVEPLTSCAFDLAPSVFSGDLTGDYVIIPLGAGACPPGDDEDDDGLADDRESVFSTLLGNSDSDLDGIDDGNDDANGNGEDDEDEDDDEDDGCPDEDSDDDGEDDEDEDDD